MAKPVYLSLDQDTLFSLQIYLDPTVPENYLLVHGGRMDFYNWH